MLSNLINDSSTQNNSQKEIKEDHESKENLVPVEGKKAVRLWKCNLDAFLNNPGITYFFYQKWPTLSLISRGKSPPAKLTFDLIVILIFFKVLPISLHLTKIKHSMAERYLSNPANQTIFQLTMSQKLDGFFLTQNLLGSNAKVVQHGFMLKNTQNSCKLQQVSLKIARFVMTIRLRRGQKAEIQQKPKMRIELQQTIN